MDVGRQALNLILNISRSVLPSAWFEKLFMWDRQRHMRLLASLPTRRVATVHELPLDGAPACIDRCRNAIAAVSTHGSHVELWGGRGRETAVGWNALVQRPDRLVANQLTGNYQNDWISIGEETWETRSLEQGCLDPCNDPAFSKGNRRFHVARYLPLLASATPTRCRLIGFQGCALTHLAWETLTGRPFECLLELEPAFLDGIEPRKSSISAWLDEDERIVCLDLSLTADDATTRGLTMTFGMYDLPLEIPDPRDVYAA